MMNSNLKPLSPCPRIQFITRPRIYTTHCQKYKPIDSNELGYQFGLYETGGNQTEVVCCQIGHPVLKLNQFHV